ncbi:MAG TPA: NrfD/PsrC family molybdoenzyme membrane anchor subunit [Verrucomicrobiae bacterium]|jgi:formate-dependent nitrite reductase membrane component NrfD|nr:NrfD/PsrC family molybdoenzyme membrane anchor subunit [Verrucomicrobiae bacterium]
MSRIDEFFIGVKPQREWGWLVITYLFLGGAGAGLFLVSLYLRHGWAGALGIALLVAGAALLLVDLGRPERFWRAFFHPRTSWISRGCFFIAAVVVFGGVQTALRIMGLEAEPGTPAATVSVVMDSIAGAAALLVMIYTGFVLAPSPAIPFWNSAFFPMVFFVYSLLAAIDILILSSPLLPGAALDIAWLERSQGYLAVACLILLLSHLSIMSGSAVAARASIRLLTHGRWAPFFLGGVVGAGLIVPLAFFTLAGGSDLKAVFAVTAVLALLRLFGDYLFRFLVIRAGMYDPLL